MQWSVAGNVRRIKRKSAIGQAVLLLLGVELLIFAAFTCLQLAVPTQHNIERYTLTSVQHGLTYLSPHWQQEICHRYALLLAPVNAVRFSAYVPLVPVAIFIGYICGSSLGLECAAIFLLLGLIGPYLGFLPLAAGGGFDYWRQPTFGYLIGLIGASWFAGRVTEGCANSLRQLLAAAGGVIITHACGLLYLFGASLSLLLFQGDNAYLTWQPWLFESARNLSWYTLPYDALLSVGLIGCGFPFRWLVKMLTAPDIAMKPKPKWDGALEQSQEEDQEPLAVY